MGSVEVTVVSARELKNVNWKNGELKAYVVVWIDPAAKCSTRADGVHDTDPIWDDKLIIPLPPSLSIDDAVLSVDIVHAADHFAAAKVKPLVGSARLPLREVLADGGTCTRTLRLTRPSGRPHGKLDLKISVREPPRHYGYSYSAPPPQPYAYGGPAPSGYGGAPTQTAERGYGYGGAPPQPAAGGYGYGGAPPQPAAAGSKSKFGMGTGLAVGAAAGILGGLALAEGVDLVEDKIADDVEEKIADDMGYDDDGDY